MTDDIEKKIEEEAERYAESRGDYGSRGYSSVFEAGARYGFELGVRMAAAACLDTYSPDGHAPGDWPTPEQCHAAILALLGEKESGK